MYYCSGDFSTEHITLADNPSLKNLYDDLVIQTRSLIKKIHDKKIKQGDIDKATTGLTHQILMDGVVKGLKIDLSKVDYSSNDGKKLKALQTHVFRFSACKNYLEVSALSSALMDPKGNPRTFEEFKTVAGKIDATFNGPWLRTEYAQAQVTATRIADYKRMDDLRDIYPTWQYKTRSDGHVREAHAALHNMKLAASDPAWALIYPPNGWNCRCFVQPLSDDPPHMGKGQQAITELQKTIVNKKTGLSEWDNMVKQGFNQNPAMTNSLYPKNHPYWRAKDSASVLKSVQEFQHRLDQAEERSALYKKLKKNNDYLDVDFNPANGGLKATHVEHLFDKRTGANEKHAQELLFQEGHLVILESEKQKIRYKKIPEGLLDDQVMEISSICGSGKNTVKKALQHAAGKGADTCVLYFTPQSNFTKERLIEGCKSFDNITPYRFKRIIYIVKDNLNEIK